MWQDMYNYIGPVFDHWRGGGWGDGWRGWGVGTTSSAALGRLGMDTAVGRLGFLVTGTPNSSNFADTRSPRPPMLGAATAF